MARRHDGGNRRSDSTTGTPSSVPEVGRLLRRARTRQGLHVEDVAARTGLNLHQLEALESGTVDRIPDRVVVLKTLRRYADFLGLPGDRFVLAVVDHWPSPVAAAPVVPVAPVAPAAPVAVAAPVVAPTTAAVAVQAQPPPTGSLPAGAVTKVGGPVQVTPHPTGVPGATSQVTAVPNTGVIPAVRPQTKPAHGSGSRRSTVALFVAIGVLGVAVLVGIGGLLIHHYEPRWLSDIGVTQSPNTPSTTTPGTAKHGHHSSTTTPAQTLTVATTSPNSANVTVHSSTFQVTVRATGGSSWVQATKSGQAAPVFSGVLASGQTQVFSGTSSLQLEVGSVAAHVTVSTGLRGLGSFVPPAAPFTMTISGTA